MLGLHRVQPALRRLRHLSPMSQGNGNRRRVPEDRGSNPGLSTFKVTSELDEQERLCIPGSGGEGVGGPCQCPKPWSRGG